MLVGCKVGEEQLGRWRRDRINYRTWGNSKRPHCGVSNCVTPPTSFWAISLASRICLLISTLAIISAYESPEDTAMDLYDPSNISGSNQIFSLQRRTSPHCLPIFWARKVTTKQRMHLTVCLGLLVAEISRSVAGSPSPLCLPLSQGFTFVLITCTSSSLPQVLSLECTFICDISSPPFDYIHLKSDKAIHAPSIVRVSHSIWSDQKRWEVFFILYRRGKWRSDYPRHRASSRRRGMKAGAFRFPLTLPQPNLILVKQR